MAVEERAKVLGAEVVIYQSNRERVLKYFNLYANLKSSSAACLTVAVSGGQLHLHAVSYFDVCEAIERIRLFPLCSPALSEIYIYTVMLPCACVSERF